MKIERQQLLNDLQDFVSQGDGVIIGSPGAGKTYVLKELRQRLKVSEIPHLLLRIDQPRKWHCRNATRRVILQR